MLKRRLYKKPSVEMLYIIGDLHLRSQRPQGRVDDYAAAQEAKLLQVLEAAEKIGAAVLQPGDFFDGIDVPWSLVERYIRLIKECGVMVYCVRGQHDLRYHSRNVENTPLGVMSAAGAVRIAGPEGVALTKDVTLFGCDWGERDVPTPRGADDILLIHRMIVEETKLWPGQVDYVRADKFLRDNRFRLIVSGDNHQHFTASWGGPRSGTRYLVNCGSLMRMAVDQVEHRPTAYLYHIDGQQLMRRPIIVSPSDEVFDVERIEKSREKNRELDAFLEELGSKRDFGLNFLDNLRAALGGLSASESGVREIVEEVLDEEQGRGEGRSGRR